MKQRPVGLQEFICEARQTGADRFQVTVNPQFVCHHPVMPANHRGLGWILLGIFIILRDDPVKHTGDHIGCIVLIRSQDIRKFPMDRTAFVAFQSADDAGVLLTTFQKKNPFTGISVRKLATAARA